MHIQTFDTVEDMQAKLAENSKAAMAGLAPQQADLDLGQHWVQFVDLDQTPPLVVFGQIATEQQAYDGWSAEDDDGPQGEAAARMRADMAESGLMFGSAASAPYPDPEWGYTHKASVWPIEPRLFEMAKAADWDITRFDQVGRVLLQIAWDGFRTHMLTKQAVDPHDTKPIRDEVAAVVDANVLLAEPYRARLLDALMALINRA